MQVKRCIVAVVVVSGVLWMPFPVSAAGLDICSFNIQFLGQSEKRDHEGLAALIKDCDVAVIQELVAPPYPGAFPDGEPFNPDPESALFFGAMASGGFKYVLSEEDTGAREGVRHVNSAATEWWVAFYKPKKVRVAQDFPSGFLADDRYGNPDWDRVPYAFGFQSKDKKLDFVLISVHLRPGEGPANRARRQHELAAIHRWIKEQESTEQDFIILGDMNLYNMAEIERATPPEFASLNADGRPTNTNVKGPLPYDHIMLNLDHTSEVEHEYGMQIINLITAMRTRWKDRNGAYPGEPYRHNAFRQYYSDHHPIRFRMVSESEDDD